MSFFKKIKDKLTSPRTNISLKFNKDNFVFGENVEGELFVSSDDEFDAMEIRCEVQCVEEAKSMKRTYDERLGREVERKVWESATLYSAKPTLSGPMHITKGYANNFPFSINLPVGGRPTYKSIDRKATWTIKGVIAVDGRPDATSRTMEIQVAQPSAAPVIKEKEVIREAYDTMQILRSPNAPNTNSMPKLRCKKNRIKNYTTMPEEGHYELR